MAKENCKGCNVTARISEEQLQKILADYLRDHPAPLADERTYRARLALCRACTDFLYGTTCRHCGCLVPVMARLAEKGCPRPGNPAWQPRRPPTDLPSRGSGG